MNFEIDEVVDRRWMIKESALDDAQHKIRYLKNGNYLVEGCAGSGKTVLALQKAKELEESGNDNYLIVLYTLALKSFVKDGLIKLGIDPDKVWNYDQLDNSGYTEVDYIIIDEVQDFTEEQLRKLIAMTRKNFILFGDDAQQVYREGLNLSGVVELTNLSSNNHRKLERNYRLPKAIARFSSHIKNDYDLVARCVTEEEKSPELLNAIPFPRNYFVSRK